MIDPKTIYLSGEAAKFHKPGAQVTLNWIITIDNQCIFFLNWELRNMGLHPRLKSLILLVLD